MDELVTGEFEASGAENNSVANLVASRSENPKRQLGILDEINTSHRI